MIDRGNHLFVVAAALNDTNLRGLGFWVESWKYIIFATSTVKDCIFNGISNAK